MNVFAVTTEGTLITPATTGSILEGITRDSVVVLARDAGFAVEERDLDVGELLTGMETGRITEVFATGTAAVITPISEINSREGTWSTRDAAAGPVTMRLRTELTDIQYGRRDDRHGWLQRLDG